MSRLFWVDIADEARIAALEHIARSSLAAALSQSDEVDRQLDRLLRHPFIGRPGRRKNTRELSINRTPFVVTYRVIGDNIQILQFRHTSQKI